MIISRPTKQHTKKLGQEDAKNPTKEPTQEPTDKMIGRHTQERTQEPTDKTIREHTQETNPKPRTAQVTSLHGSPHQPQLILSGYYYGHPARILLDCGATGDFISRDYVATHNLPTSSQTPLDITLADGITQETCDSRTTPSNLCIGPYSIKTGFDLTMLNSDYNIILGMPWLTDENLHIDWVKCQLTIRQGSHSI